MGKITDKIYPLVPVWMQNIGISIFGYAWQKRRFGGIFNSELQKFKERESFTEQDWKEYQTQELRKILVHAYENVTFYRDKYSKAGFTLEDFKNFEIEDLNKLPFLEKDELRQFGKTTLLSSTVDKDGAYYSSSGSTGTPTSIYISKSMHQKWTAGYEVRVKNWAGVNKNMVRGMIGGRRILPSSKAKAPFYRYNFFEKMVYYSAYHISKQTAENYVEGMKKHKVDFMMGYAMSNFFLARLINELQLDAPKLKAVITSSEKLTAEMREEFKKAYGCESFDTWSGVEACAQISECEHHVLHESPDIGIIEVIDDNNQYVISGNAGEAICTSFINYNQPLIRYRCGDVLRPSDTQCKCGRHMRVYDEIVGRLEDVVIGADGREMVRFHGIFINLPNIVEGQVIQNSVTDFEIKVVTTNLLTESEEQTIRKRMESQLGSMNLVISNVASIPKGPNGKFKAVISNVKRDNK
ncbi:MAG: phenylacetate--CoA ligase family protein [Bacteroidota bacterium]